MCRAIDQCDWMNQRSFGQNVCRLRTEKNWTQAMLADRAAISRRHLQMIESGRGNPSLQVMTKIALALQCSWDDLLGKLATSR